MVAHPTASQSASTNGSTAATRRQAGQASTLNDRVGLVTG
jgi:hypothetical protein